MDDRKVQAFFIFLRLFLRARTLLFCLPWFFCLSAQAGLIDPASVSIIAGKAGANGGDVGQYASFAHDAGGGQHVAYYDATFQRLKYAHRSSPSVAWVIQSLSTASLTGQYCSLAVGPEQSVTGDATVTNGSNQVL